MTTVTTTDINNGTVTDASVVNANFTAVKNTVNGNIDNTNISATAAARPSTSGPVSMPSRAMSVMTNAAAVGNQPRASDSCTPDPSVQPCTATSPLR